MYKIHTIQTRKGKAYHTDIQVNTLQDIAMIANDMYERGTGAVRATLYDSETNFKHYINNFTTLYMTVEAGDTVLLYDRRTIAGAVLGE